MSATQIDDKIIDALSALLKSNGGPFALVERYAVVGDPTSAELMNAVGNRSPALLSAFEFEENVPELTVTTLVGGLEQSVARAWWRLFVLIHDTQSDTTAVRGSVTRKGALELCGLVKKSLVGLPIANSVGSRAFEFSGWKPVRIERGNFYAYTLRFNAKYYEEIALEGDTSIPLSKIDFDINFPDLFDDDNPVVRGRVTL